MFKHIKLTEETADLVLSLLREATSEYAVTIFSFHVATKNNYLEIFKKEQGVHGSEKILKEVQDPHYKKQFLQKFLSDTLDIEFLRNEGKNSIKYYGKQQQRLKNFLPFGTDFFFEEGNKYAVSIYTRKGSPLTDVSIFTVKTASDYLRDIVSQQRQMND